MSKKIGCGGVFYREFTTLSVVHTHYLMLGMVFFLMLVLLLIAKLFEYESE